MRVAGLTGLNPSSIRIGVTMETIPAMLIGAFAMVLTWMACRLIMWGLLDVEKPNHRHLRAFIAALNLAYASPIVGLVVVIALVVGGNPMFSPDEPYAVSDDSNELCFPGLELEAGEWTAHSPYGDNRLGYDEPLPGHVSSQHPCLDVSAMRPGTIFAIYFVNDAGEERWPDLTRRISGPVRTIGIVEDDNSKLLLQKI